MCLDALVTFGVKQVPESSDGGNGLDWDKFKLSAQLLINRERTGHAARDEILHLMSLATSEQWNDWYRRILIKDLRCGVSQKTVNNVSKKMGLNPGRIFFTKLFLNLNPIDLNNFCDIIFSSLISAIIILNEG